MVGSRPASRPVSRSNSISEAPINIPVDPRVAGPHASRPHTDRRDTAGEPTHGHHHHNNQDPKLFGPGFSSAPVHSAVESQIRYVLVTPDMMRAIESGNAPDTNLVQPAGTTLKTVHTHTAHPDTFRSDVPTLEKGEHGQMQESVDTKHALSEAPSSDLVEEENLLLANPISRLRHKIKEPLAEFIGTMVLIIFGNGVNCQVVLSNLTQGSYLSISFGWGIGVMMGVYIAGGVSGAHLSPAVTIALATWRGFPWRKVPQYVLAQFLGACVGSCLIQGNYKNLIDTFEGGNHVRTFGLPTSTGSLFFTAAQPYMTNISAFFSEVFATAVLLAVILCLGDANNNPCPPGMNGLILMFLILGIGAALGTQTAYCLNPARDFGPRVAAAMYGYGGGIWTYRNHYWLWCAIIAPICGAVLGGFVYDLLVFQGPESPMNRPWGNKNRKQKAIEA